MKKVRRCKLCAVVLTSANEADPRRLRCKTCRADYQRRRRGGGLEQKACVRCSRAIPTSRTVDWCAGCNTAQQIDPSRARLMLEAMEDVLDQGGCLFVEPRLPAGKSGTAGAQLPSDALIDALWRGMGPLSLTEVGVLMGCTRERVRQVEELALRRLKRPDAGLRGWR